MLPDSCAIASKFLRSRQPLKPRASTNRFCAQAARSRNGLSGVRAVITEPRRERFHCKTPGKRRRKRPVQPTPSLSHTLLPSLSLPYTICTVFRCICVHLASNISTGKTAPGFGRWRNEKAASMCLFCVHERYRRLADDLKKAKCQTLAQISLPTATLSSYGSDEMVHQVSSRPDSNDNTTTHCHHLAAFHLPPVVKTVLYDFSKLTGLFFSLCAPCKKSMGSLRWKYAEVYKDLDEPWRDRTKLGGWNDIVADNETGRCSVLRKIFSMTTISGYTGAPLRVSRILFIFLLKGRFLGISRNLLFLGDMQKKISGIVGYFRAYCIAWM